MTTKNCTLCKKEKSLDSFNKRIRSKDGHQNVCKECNGKQSKRYYKKHKAKHKEKTKKQKLEIQTRNRRFLWNYLEEHPCIDCGYSNPIALEFDHVRGKKIAALSQLASDCWSLEKIKEEISKCEVRCANCHRIKTANQLNWYKNINKGSSPNGMAADF